MIAKKISKICIVAIITRFSLINYGFLWGIHLLCLLAIKLYLNFGPHNF